MKTIKRKTVYTLFFITSFVLFCMHMYDYTNRRRERGNYVNNGASLNAKYKTKTRDILQEETIGGYKSKTCAGKTKQSRSYSGIQMSEEQINVICDALPENGNLLVWGLGNDSPFWHNSTDGKVIFIEDDIPVQKAGIMWYDEITKKYPFLEAYRVHYTTDTVASFDKYVNNPERWYELDLRAQLPVSVTQTHWHVIIVDAPLGCCESGPGRYQSIYTSSILAKAGTHIFVDDFERKVEHEFSLKTLGTPLEVIKRQKTKSSNANEQAHFIQNSKKQTANGHRHGTTSDIYTAESLNIDKKKADNWTILLSVNNGFFDFFKNWRWHFKQLQMKIQIFVMAEDSIVFERIIGLNDSSVEVQRSEHISINESLNYNSALYKKMVSARPNYILAYLKKGINVIYSDIDTVWLQNPLPYLNGGADIWSQFDKKDYFCTGFLAIKSNNNTLSFIQKWADALKDKPDLNQVIFNSLVKKSHIKIKGLDSKRFPSGKQYFEQFSKEERSGVVIVHNNWIIGHDRKLERFKNMTLWVNDTI